MSVLLGKIQEYYNFVFYDLCDYRTRDMFPSPPFLFITLASYLYFCKSLGPRLMKDVKPFQLKNTILIYNIIQIIASSYILIMGLNGGWLHQYNWKCQAVDMTENPYSKRMVQAFWWYTVIKLVDLLDTIFFVLRKKDRQISFLHVFHHTMMPAASCIGLKYFPNGQASFIGIINCVVHIVMYTYYLISGLGPQYQKFLWWKKNVTTLQLIQFTLIFIHQLAAIQEDCGFPKWVSVLLCIHSVIFMYLFGKFYYDNYIVKPKNKHKNGSLTNGKSKTN